jgi:hypothetical protein
MRSVEVSAIRRCRLWAGWLQSGLAACWVASTLGPGSEEAAAWRRRSWRGDGWGRNRASSWPGWRAAVPRKLGLPGHHPHADTIIHAADREVAMSSRAFAWHDLYQGTMEKRIPVTKDWARVKFRPLQIHIAMGPGLAAGDMDSGRHRCLNLLMYDCCNVLCENCMSYHCHCPDTAVVFMELNCKKRYNFPTVTRWLIWDLIYLRKIWLAQILSV